MTLVSRAVVLLVALWDIASTAEAGEVNLWLDRAQLAGGSPVAIEPAHPQGRGSSIDLDATGRMIRGALNLEGYELDGAPVAPWAGTLEWQGTVNGGDIYGVQDPKHPWPVSLPGQVGTTWRLELTRFANASDFAGELSLHLFADDGNGYWYVTHVLFFRFESVAASQAACAGAVLLLDEDRDGEADARDLQSHTLDDVLGPGVDENGLSIAEFCAAAGGSDERSCEALDFRNDEPLRKQPRDCTFVSGRCQGAEFFGTTASAAAPRTCLDHALFDDADADGEPDTTDRCPSTPRGVAIDGNGCSAAQFCSEQSAQLCRRADFLNDEPLVKKPGDCALTRSKPRACSAAGR